MRIENKMYRQVEGLSKYPAFMRNWLLNFAMRSFVPFIRTSDVVFDKVTREEVAVHVKNKKKVQNHIHGVHACVMALLAETASGFVFNMNVPDDKLPLAKSMNIKYVKKTVGDMRAVATLDEEAAMRIKDEEKGNMPVTVTVWDETDEPPVVIDIVWAWVPKKKK